MHPMLSMLSADAVVSERAHHLRRRRPSLATGAATGSADRLPAAPGAAAHGRRRRGLLWHLRLGSPRTG
jgi:hypothetical protein